MKNLKLSFLSIFFVIFIILILAFLLADLEVRAVAPPRITATAAAVVDVETGQILYEKQIHLCRPPASLTKVLTAIIAIEEGNLKEKVKVSRRAAYQEGSSIYLEEGEELSLEELLYGVMLASGNDAAVAVAEHISGSVEEFARLMNKKAKEMGAKNSNFVNPSGLPHPDHYSTAYDLAMIMRQAMKNEVFARITATKYKTISWADNDWGRGLRNHNKLLWSYPDITGGKTGYTRAAGRCLITSAKRNGREVIAVVLNSPNDWLEVRTLLDYGLDNFKRVKVIEKGDIIHQLEWEGSREGEISFLAERPLTVLVPEGGKIKIRKEVYLKPELKLPIRKGEIIGSLYLYAGEQLLGKTELIALNDLNYNSIFLRFWHWVISLKER